MDDIKVRLDKVKELIQNPDFLEGKGLSNEVNIRIFCYNPEDEMIVRHFIGQLTSDNTLSCRIIEYDLYKTFLTMCDDKRITNGIPRMEEKKGSEGLLKELQKLSLIDSFIENMQYEPHQQSDVIIIDGVGKAFPFIRVHSLLEAMQPHFSDIPILVMYPGEFTGRYLKLFNQLEPNDYYRAFNVI